MPSVLNCVPEGEHVRRDLAELVKVPKGFEFTPADAKIPRGGPPIAHLTDPKDAMEKSTYEIVHTAMKEDPKAFPELGVFYRIPREFYKDVQADTGIPIFSWYSFIEKERNIMEVKLAKLHAELHWVGMKTNVKSRERAFISFEARKHGVQVMPDVAAEFTEAEVELGDRVLGKMFGGWLKDEMKFSQEAVDQFLNELPKLRSHQGDVDKFISANRGISAPMTLARKALQTKEISYDMREWDLLKVVNRFSIAIANERHLSPAIEHIIAQAKNLEAQGVKFPPNLKNHFEKYLAQVKHQPDALQIGLARAWNGIVKRLPINEKWGIHENLDIAAKFASVNYFANMAWNPGFVLRNYLQALLPMATVGFESGGKGLRIATKWLRDPKLKEYYINRGITTRESLAMMEKELTEGLDTLQYSSKTQQFFSWLRENGQSWFKQSEGFVRVASYEMGKIRAMKYMPEYKAGKMSWDQFLEQSKLDMRDKKGGQFLKMVKEYVDAGDFEEAGYLAGKELMISTQFMYSRGNVPYFMQSTQGRLLGQYGTWPAWFAEHMRGLALRGSPANRIKALSRFMLINGAVYEGGKEIFGVDTGKWTFFSPMGYQGGPLLQIGMHGAAKVADLVTPGAPDTVQAIQAARLKSDWTQFAPIPTAALRGVYRAGVAIGDEDYKTAIKRLLNFPAAKEQ